MRKFEREPTPTVLVENGDRWTKELEARGATGAGRFRWPIHAGSPLNRHLLPALKRQTQEHCSFCDVNSAVPPGTETIEHFRPKSKFPEEAYSWPNLYLACNHCQSSKRDRFDEDLLRPDVDFEFGRYFLWDIGTGELRPNPGATRENQRRAERTIEVFGLNKKHPPQRRRFLMLFGAVLKSGEALKSEDWPYRGFLGCE